MFCYQCEQTAKGTGCTVQGVCGKTAEVAELQDLIIYALKGMSVYANELASMGCFDDEINRIVVEGLFTTVTNVNFDPASLERILASVVAQRERARGIYESKAQDVRKFNGAATFQFAADNEGLHAQAVEIGIAARKEKIGEDLAGLQELITYGLKGMAAYADHARILGQQDNAVYAYMFKALATLETGVPAVEPLFDLAMECGTVNLKTMELLDTANVSSYGAPEPTTVRVSAVKGKAILVSGHDLKDLDQLLQQTAGKGINIYTHGEMLPTNAYPVFKKYSHFAGNYGGAWQDQRDEFDKFPGPILLTTNCIQKPRDSYFDRIFTSGLVQWPGVKHVSNGDFSPVIESALNCDGFPEDEPVKEITIGFAKDAVMSVAGTVIDLVKAGKIKHFYLIGGCDGAKSGRNYYTDFATSVPQDSIILTLACGKFRFNKLEFGDIEGIPRLLDIGQCNDAYSAIKIAVALAGAFDCGVNDLPLSFILSWYEQKAVVILLTLLSLGIKNIKLGPTLPAFVSPAVLNVLVEKFNIAPISTVEADM